MKAGKLSGIETSNVDEWKIIICKMYLHIAYSKIITQYIWIEQTLGTPIQSVSWLYNQSSVGIQLNFGSHEYEFGQRYVKEEFEKEILGLDRRPPHLPPPHT